MTFELSGWLGGQYTVTDTASLMVNFLDENGTQIGSQGIPSVTAQDRNNVTGLSRRSIKGTVPAGTRRLDIRLLFAAPARKNMILGYADDISFTLTQVVSAIDVQPERIYNAASQLAGPIAPGEMIEIAVNGINLQGLTEMQRVWLLWNDAPNGRI